MFRLKYDKVRDEYQIHSRTSAFTGPMHLICAKAVELGVEPKEIIVALDQLDKYQHNVAEFGVLGSFIMTKKD